MEVLERISKPVEVRFAALGEAVEVDRWAGRSVSDGRYSTDQQVVDAVAIERRQHPVEVERYLRVASQGDPTAAFCWRASSSSARKASTFSLVSRTRPSLVTD